MNDPDTTLFSFWGYLTLFLLICFWPWIRHGKYYRAPKKGMLTELAEDANVPIKDIIKGKVKRKKK